MKTAPSLPLPVFPLGLVGRAHHVVQTHALMRGYVRVFGYPFLPYHLGYALLRAGVVIGPQDHVLDLGCGDGAFLHQLAREYGCSGVGVDRLPHRIREADRIREALNLPLRFQHGAIEAVDLFELSGGRPFSLALLFDVLEHVDDPRAVIGTAVSALRGGGRLVIRTPLDGDAKYLLREERFGYGEDAHVREGLGARELEQMLKEAGARVVKTIPHYFPFTQISYEVLELVRRRSPLVHAALWPWLLPLCVAETRLQPNRRANGLLVVAEVGCD
jgi:SAM-dependent methyltransferase